MLFMESVPEYETGDLRKHESVAAYGDYYSYINKKVVILYGVTESASTNSAKYQNMLWVTRPITEVINKSSGINTCFVLQRSIWILQMLF